MQCRTSSFCQAIIVHASANVVHPCEIYQLAAFMRLILDAILCFGSASSTGHCIAGLQRKYACMHVHGMAVMARMWRVFIIAANYLRDSPLCIAYAHDASRQLQWAIKAVETNSKSVVYTGIDHQPECWRWRLQL